MDLAALPEFENKDFYWLWMELHRIANALERLTTPPDQTAPSTPASCPHPPDHRIDLGLTNGQPDWQCRICRYRPTPATL
jgi:hypothetical protein